MCVCACHSNLLGLFVVLFQCTQWAASSLRTRGIDVDRVSCYVLHIALEFFRLAWRVSPRYQSLHTHQQYSATSCTCDVAHPGNS